MRGNLDFGGAERRMIEHLMARPDRRGRRYTGDEAFDKRVTGPWQDLQPKPAKFKDIYSPEEIAADLKKVETIEQGAQFEVDRSPDAVFLEYGMMEGIHNNEWLGEGVNVTPAAEYDDVVNGVDLVAAVPGADEKVYYLGVDITTSDNQSVQAKKLDRTLRTLDQNRLSQVKYFEDDADPEKRGSIFVPRVVISATGDRLRRIKEGFTKNRQYALDEDIKQEMVAETLDQLINSVKHLLTHHFSESAEQLHGNDEVLAYYAKHQDAIARNTSLQENIEKHIGLIRYLEGIKEIK